MRLRLRFRRRPGMLRQEDDKKARGLNKINIGADVPEQLANDHAAEAGAIKAYNEGIVQAGECKDFAAGVPGRPDKGISGLSRGGLKQEAC